jgi:hypothetical protein
LREFGLLGHVPGVERRIGLAVTVPVQPDVAAGLEPLEVASGSGAVGHGDLLALADGCRRPGSRYSRGRGACGRHWPGVASDLARLVLPLGGWRIGIVRDALGVLPLVDLGGLGLHVPGQQQAGERGDADAGGHGGFLAACGGGCGDCSTAPGAVQAR